MRDQDIDALVDALSRIRERDYLSIAGMARRLGFSAGHLSMVFSGKRRPGIRFVRAVFEHYPEIRRQMAHRLSDRGHGALR
jgi:hypothetical protein